MHSTFLDSPGLSSYAIYFLFDIPNAGVMRAFDPNCSETEFFICPQRTGVLYHCLGSDFYRILGRAVNHPLATRATFF